MKKIIFILLILFLGDVSIKSQDLCRDYLLLDGLEQLSEFGLDTTNNWWAITVPISGSKRMIINGKESTVFREVSKPVFSPDSKRWAFFAEDNVSLLLVMNDTIINLGSSKAGQFVFSGNSEQYVYSYNVGETEYIKFKDKSFEIINGSGQLYIDYFGSNIAFAIRKGYNNYVLKNYQEFGYYDGIKIIGFDNNSKIVYAAQSGNGWQIYKDNKAISEVYSNITEFKINLEGTVTAAVARNFANKFQAILISDEYYEPIVGKPYDVISNLSLHPTVSLYSYKAKQSLNEYIVFNSAEYAAGTVSGGPSFSYNGDEMFFIGCELDCYLSINGRRYILTNTVEVNIPIAVAPGTETYAYSTSSSLVISKLNTKNLHAGMMVDYVSAPRYNQFDKKYEALGVISNKLYLLTCKAK